MRIVERYIREGAPDQVKDGSRKPQKLEPLSEHVSCCAGSSGVCAARSCLW